MGILDYFSSLGARTTIQVTQPAAAAYAPSSPVAIPTTQGGGGTIQNRIQDPAPTFQGVVISASQRVLQAAGSGVQTLSKAAEPITTTIIKAAPAALTINPLTYPVGATLIAADILTKRQSGQAALVAPSQRSIPATVDPNKIYAVGFAPEKGTVAAGADFSRTQIVKGLAIAKPELLPETIRFQTGVGSVFTGGQPFKKEGEYSYVGASRVTQHGQTEEGWLYKSTEGLYFLAKPAQEIIGLGTVRGQGVPMSGGQAAWQGMTESGRLSVSPLLVPVGGEIVSVKEVGGKPSSRGILLPTGESAIKPAAGPQPAVPAITEDGWVKVQSRMRPSEFSSIVLSTPLAQTPLARPLIDTSDFLLGSTNPASGLLTMVPNALLGRNIFERSMEDIYVGPAVKGQAKTITGQPTQEIKDLGGGKYEITTLTPITTVEETSIPTKTVITPIKGGYDIGEERFAGEVTKKAIPEITFKPTGNVALDYLESLGIGIVSGVREKPLSTVTNIGVGTLMVAGGEAIAGLGAATKAGTIGTTLYPVAAGAEFLSTKAFPAALVGLYGVDVAGRTTAWGKDTSPKAAERFGAILGTEIIPFAVGGAAVSPMKTAARMQEIDIKAFVQEKYNVRPAQYPELSTRQAMGMSYDYLKTKVTRPVDLGMIEYRSMKQEGVVSGPAEYVKYKASLPAQYGLAKAEALGITVGEVRARAAEIPTKIYTGAFDTRMAAGTKLAEMSIDYYSYKFSGPREPNVPGYLQSKAYPLYFEAKTRAPVLAEKAVISAETGLWTAGQYAKNPLINIRAYLQERGATQRIPAGIGRGESGGGIGLRRTPSEGGIGGRITAKTVGGKSVFGLSKEPSLKSLGIRETGSQSKGTTLLSKQSIDFRGQAPERMKPMGTGSTKGKQASSQIAILSEKLPMGELRRPEVRRAGQRTIFEQSIGLMPAQAELGMQRLSAYQRRGTVQVIQPEFQTSQRSRTLVSRDILTSEIAGITQARRSSQYQAMAEDVIRGQRRAAMSSSAARTRYGELTETRFMRETGRDLTRRSDETFRTGYSYIISPRTTTTTGSRTTFEQKTDTIVDRKIIQIPTIIPPVWGYPGLPQGSGAGERRGKWKNPFREIIPVKFTL